MANFTPKVASYRTLDFSQRRKDDIPDDQIRITYNEKSSRYVITFNHYLSALIEEKKADHMEVIVDDNSGNHFLIFNPEKRGLLVLKNGTRTSQRKICNKSLVEYLIQTYKLKIDIDHYAYLKVSKNHSRINERISIIILDDVK